MTHGGERGLFPLFSKECQLEFKFLHAFCMVALKLHTIVSLFSPVDVMICELNFLVDPLKYDSLSQPIHTWPL